MMSEDDVQTKATKPVDLEGDDSLIVTIADALNEQDIVKFTVHTKTTLDQFKKRDFQVIRLHEEFVWLHDRFLEDPKYAGLLIPPCPPKPDFSSSHGKLAKLKANDATMTPEEMEKLKQEIQAEYLAAFQKTVAMHEVFLLRLVSHQTFRTNDKLQAFLEFEGDLACKAKSRSERAGNFFKNVAKGFDSSLQTFKEADEYFDEQRGFIIRYINMIKDSVSKCQTKIKKRQSLVQSLGQSGTSLTHIGHMYPPENEAGEIVRTVGASIMKCQSIEKKLASKEDLKLGDLLTYYLADATAAKQLMFRRVKALQDEERAEKANLKAQATGKKTLEAADAAKSAKDKAQDITKTSKEELLRFKERRVAAFRKGIIQYSQAQIRRGREQYQMWKNLLEEVKN